MVPWLRAHRRNSSNPTSPLPSSIQSPGSPRTLPDANRSPELGSARSDAPSPRLQFPSFSEQGQQQDRTDGAKSTHQDVRAAWDSVHHKSSSSFDRLRPASSSGAMTKSPKLASHSNLSQQSLINNPSFMLNDHGGQPQSPVEEKVQFYSAGAAARSSVSQFSNPSTDRLTLDDSVESSKGPSSRSRLNLLNPMSLLARRRSSQALVPKQEDLTMKNLAVPAIPDDFVPSIRGTLIHDFSTPRNRRNLSSNDAARFQAPDTNVRPSYDYSRRRSDVTGHYALLSSPESRHSEHSPIFKEHFNDDRNALQVESKGYLHSMAAASLYPPSPDREPPPIPAFARNLPLTLPDESISDSRLPAVPETIVPLSESPPPPPPPPKEHVSGPRTSSVPSRPAELEDVVSEPHGHGLTASSPSASVSSSSSQNKRTGKAGSASSQAGLPKRVASNASRFSFETGDVERSSSYRAGLPTRVASNASRFSFDTGGVEKLMEERHKQKEAAKKAERPTSIADESDEGNFDYDDFDDGLEERIPGVNADADEGDFDYDNVNETQEEPIPGVNADADADEDDDDKEPEEAFEKEPKDIRKVEEPKEPATEGLQAFHFTPAMTVLSPTTTPHSSAASQPTPRDEHGQSIGFALSRESPDLSRLDTFEGNGLGIMAVDGHTHAVKQPLAAPSAETTTLDEDDLYYDDGDIQGVTDDDGGSTFDETIFDDETSHLHDRPVKVPVNLGHLIDRDLISPDITESETDGDGFDDEFSPNNDVGYSAIVQAFSKPGAPRIWASVNQSSQKAAVPKPVGLTEDNLAAYHRALVTAANEAAARGRFSHQENASQVSEGSEETENPGLVSDDSRVTSQNVDIDTSGIEEIHDDFNYEDDVDDDPIIAEANAEALENDDEGFYGQEFGFYARAHGNCASEQVNGGYFGPRGVEGVSRSHSGRANFQEPSLTPITERSEWSTRNSVISLTTHGIPHSAQAIPSPGIAQLVDMGNFDNDQMSLTALMKLRRGAWGGSNGSLHSSAGSQASSSPLAHLPPTGFGPTPMETANRRMSTSAYSLNGSAGILESEEEDDDSSASPTITLANPMKTLWDRPPRISHMAATEASPISPIVPVRERGHSRNSSGTESISYVKEKDADGAGRWVLERRRTGDSGEVELIGREILAGGRI